jgi:PAS domain S-box-containing protein
MTLRRKSQLIVGLAIAALIVVLFFTSEIIVLSSFARLEERNTRLNVEQAQDALADDLAQLNITAGDYAGWDDTYAFIEDANPAYVEANTGAAVLSNLQINLWAFVHASGRIVFSKAFDLDTEAELPFPDSLSAYLSVGSPLLRHADTESSVAGIVLLPEGPVLLVSRPILTSEYQGPIRGALIMGRYLNATKIGQLAQTTHLSLAVYPIGGAPPPDVQAARAALSEDKPIQVRPLGDQAIAGYALLKDLDGQPALVLRVDTPRDIYQQGLATVRYFFLWLVAIGLVFGVAAQALLDKWILSQQARQESEERFRAVVEQSAEGVLLVDTGTKRVLEANAAFWTLLGYDEKDAPALTLYDIVAHDRAEVDRDVERILAAPRHFIGEQRYRRADASIVEVESSANLVAHRGKTVLSLVVRDITARKQVEAQIRAHARQQAVVAELGQRALIGADLSTLMDEAVAQVARTLEVEFCKVLELLPGGRLLLLRAGVGWRAGYVERATVDAGMDSQAGYTLSTQASVIVEDLRAETRFSGPALLLEHGVVSGMSVIIPGRDRAWGVLGAHATHRRTFSEDDVHFLQAIANVLAEAIERRRAEEALRQTQKLESLGVLAGGVAHDFNNLLVALLGQTSLALAKLPPDSPARSHIEKAVRAAERAGDLTRQMLAYSGHGAFQIRPFYLNDLIRENLHLFEASISRNVQLRSRLAEPLPLIAGDIGQMQQVVMNLIINAAEAIGPQSGTVTVTTGVRPVSRSDDGDPSSYVGAPPAPGTYVTLEVEDDGCGMDADTLARIFDPFFTTKATGRGLGLPAVLGIVRGHKGGLQVMSEPGKGTAFRLLFPAVHQAEAELAGDEESAPGDLASHSSSLILVIDDEAPVREAVADVLEIEGLRVIAAPNGKTGLALYREQQAEVRLVLLDLSMPGLSGEETFRELRQINPNVKVVLSSGYNQVDATRQFAGRGLAGFIQKPYDASTLIAEIRRHLA